MENLMELHYFSKKYYQIVSINHQLTYRKYEGDPHATFRITLTKGKNTRIIPMTNRLRKVLLDLKKDYKYFHTEETVDGMSGFLFCTMRGSLQVTSMFNSDLKALVNEYNKIAEYPIDEISSHTLRHTPIYNNFYTIYTHFWCRYKEL